MFLKELVGKITDYIIEINSIVLYRGEIAIWI